MIISTTIYVLYGISLVWGFVSFILTDGRMGFEGGGYRATVESDFGDYFYP